jgi:hypothetical protein
MEVHTTKTWRKKKVRNFEEARKTYLYAGERRILEYLNFVNLATIGDIARATELSEKLLQIKYLRELEGLGFIKKLKLQNTILYEIDKWGMLKLAEQEYGNDTLDKKELRKLAKEQGIYIREEPVAFLKHKILRAKAGAEIYRAYKEAQEQGIQTLEILSETRARRFLKELLGERGKTSYPNPDFVLTDKREMIFIEVETGANTKSDLRGKLVRYRNMEQFAVKNSLKLYAVFVVEGERSKEKYIAKMIQAQQPGGRYSFSADVGFKRVLFTIKELAEWLSEWKGLQPQMERWEFLREQGQVFTNKTLQEIANEIQMKYIQEEQERQKREKELKERKEKEERERQEREEQERKRQEFMQRYTRTEFDGSEEIQRQAQTLEIVRTYLQPGPKITIIENNIVVEVESLYEFAEDKRSFVYDNAKQYAKVVIDVGDVKEKIQRQPYNDCSYLIFRLDPIINIKMEKVPLAEGARFERELKEVIRTIDQSGEHNLVYVLNFQV